MTFEILKKVIEMNDIPDDVELLQDCGWECCATELNGVWYNAERNEIQFTQSGKKEFDNEDEFSDRPRDLGPWMLLYYDDGKGRRTELMQNECQAEGEKAEKGK